MRGAWLRIRAAARRRCRCGGRGEVAEIVGDDAASAGIVGELGEGFVVWVRKNREPAEGELPFLGTGAEGVEQGVNFAEGKAEIGGVALEDFLVFVDEVVADDSAPWPAAKRNEDIERAAEP